MVVWRLMKMYEPVIFRREDFCPHCKNERSLMIYDCFGNMFNYPNILDRKDYALFTVSDTGKTFVYMKCNHCGKEFFIDWSQGIPPRPMFASFYRTFMKNYKLTKKY